MNPFPMKTFVTVPLLSLSLALLPLAPARGQGAPADSDTPTPTPTMAAAAAAPAATPEPTAVPAPTRAPETPLHEIGTAPTATAAPSAPPAPTPEAHPHHHHRNDEDNRVSFGSDNLIESDEVVPGNAVAVLGSLDDNGTVDGNAVAICGHTYVNGTVHGNVVAVCGDLTLGPNARIDGNAVCVLGALDKDPQAVVEGSVVPIGSDKKLSDTNPAASFWRHGLSKGRPMAFGPHLHVFWLINLVIIGIYLLLGAIFPNGVKRCADTLATRPGITFLTGFLSLLGLPLLFILLIVTVVGIPVALAVIPLGILACLLMGKAAVYALIGRSILGKQANLVLAMLLGVAIVLAIYLVPVIGLALFFLVSFLGFSCALTALFSSGKAATPPGTPPAVPPAGFVPVAPAPGAVPVIPVPLAVPPVSTTAAPVSETAPLGGAVPLAAAVPVAASSAPPPVMPASDLTYPRAGFWIRMLALLIDVILISIVAHSRDTLFFPMLAVYAALLWKLKGSTVGGIICGLKVVRHDGRPMDWASAIVRALACFFSLVFVGLGFIWIAFDSEKQGWHDKIAGTIVLRVPKAVSLV
jgi:uncharacterized RDD family membrane protein YckC